MKNLMRIGELTKNDIYDLLDFADEVKARYRQGIDFKPLLGMSIITAFPPTSLRTRVFFEAGIYQLGAQAINLPINFEGKEALEDIVGYLNCWIHGLVLRYPEQTIIERVAQLAEFSVVNAMSKKYHPCEILSDLQSIRELRTDLTSLKFVFLGEGANISNTWFDAAARLDLNVTQICPPGYEISNEIFDFARSNSKGDISITNDIEKGLKDADIILTDGWPATEEAAERLRPYQLDMKKLNIASRDCIINPCPPFIRGNEVTSEVMASTHFIGYAAKENLLHMQKAILTRLMM